MNLRITFNLVSWTLPPLKDARWKHFLSTLIQDVQFCQETHIELFL